LACLDKFLVNKICCCEKIHSYGNLHTHARAHTHPHPPPHTHFTLRYTVFMIPVHLYQFHCTLNMLLSGQSTNSEAFIIFTFNTENPAFALTQHNISPVRVTPIVCAPIIATPVSLT
jgi:hypothetical protein